MKRSTKPRRTGWSRRTHPPMSNSQFDTGRSAEKDGRDIPTRTLGPYEAVYDISLGYAHDRAIVMP